MKHNAVDVKRLAAKLKLAAGQTPIVEIAKSTKIEASRISKFLNGDFKKMTSVLNRLCNHFGVKESDYLIKPSPIELSPDILAPLRKIIGRDPKKARAAAKLFRNLEMLVNK